MQQPPWHGQAHPSQRGEARWRGASTTSSFSGDGRRQHAPRWWLIDLAALTALTALILGWLWPVFPPPLGHSMGSLSALELARRELLDAVEIQIGGVRRGRRWIR